MKSTLKLCPWLVPALEQLERAAVAGRLGHGWLITGPRGVGKRNLAGVLAERILLGTVGSALPDPATPDSAGAAVANPDLHRVAPEEDKQSLSVEQIRATLADLALTSHTGGAKLVIIEQADRMTTAAANALLKSLEEPTGSTYLLLLAERPGRLPATVRSRCQHLPLKPPPPELARRWLADSAAAATGTADALPNWPPLELAGLIGNEEKYKNYSKLSADIEAFSKGRADPHALAEDWQKRDPELALGCLIDALRATIRHGLVPAHTTRITDPSGRIMDNCLRNGSIDSLFDRLRTAENLREQIGRGTNIELAMKALLLSLDLKDDKRLHA